MEVLATGAAFIFPLLVVGGEVKVQVGRGDESFVAVAAAVRLQTHPSVWPPAIGGAAARLAGSAFEGTVSFVHVIALGGG